MTIYDLHGVSTFPWYGVVVIGLAALVVIAISSKSFHSGLRLSIFGWLAVLFALTICILGISSVFFDNDYLLKKMEHGDFATICGAVRDYHALEWYQHGSETFSIAGHDFELSGALNPGMSKTNRPEQLTENGTNVCIDYVGDTIVRVKLATKKS